VEPLAEALREAIFTTDGQRYQMGLNGRALVEKKYTWPAIADQMKRAYEWVLHSGGSCKTFSGVFAREESGVRFQESE
jgi:hypothetical protein